MSWWGWIIFGALLFSTELMIVDLKFYLMFVGMAAIIVGLLDLTGIAWQPWAEWLTFAVVAVISIYFFRKQAYHRGHS